MVLITQKCFWPVLLVWGLSLCVGIGLEIRHELSAATQADPPRLWPVAADSLLQAGSVGSSEASSRVLLIFLHPHCPCSRASLTELTRVLADLSGPTQALVLFVKPPGTPVGWEESNLWKAAQQTPGVTVACDEGGRWADIFEATHSGQTRVYDHGQLVFHGGITAGRGHVGPSSASELLVAQLHHPSGLKCTPAFGCPLRRSAPTSGGMP